MITTTQTNKMSQPHDETNTLNIKN
jgi:hypothetical protein